MQALSPPHPTPSDQKLHIDYSASNYMVYVQFDLFEEGEVSVEVLFEEGDVYVQVDLFEEREVSVEVLFEDKLWMLISYGYILPIVLRVVVVYAIVNLVTFIH